MNPSEEKYRNVKGFFQSEVQHISSWVSDWYRTTWTLQDDPCNEYYKDLMVSPFLLVPPSKVESTGL